MPPRPRLAHGARHPHHPRAVFRGLDSPRAPDAVVLPKTMARDGLHHRPSPGRRVRHHHAVARGRDDAQRPSCSLAVEAPHRLVSTNLLGPDFKPNAIPDPGFGFVCELRFDRLPDGCTRYQAAVHHVDAAGRDAHDAMGFEAGWGAALAQLVEMMQATTDESRRR
jgi:uncharacterized protein YndB with AHSA1/START domain